MRIGSIRGFELRVHWSTLVIFGLLTWSLAAVQLPDQAPDRSPIAYVAAALVAGVAFYGALLAHEVSHALVARREGIKVRRLTLWLLGGIAELEGEPRTPSSDLRISGSGPVVSLTIGVVAAALAVGLAGIDASELVVATVAWLSAINLVLAVFNLIPAAPLDGGRILRAGLWAWRRDRRWAAVAAARAGEVFGYLLVGVGIASLFFPGVGGLWFLVVGWFVINAARAERTQAELRDLLDDVAVADGMTPDPVTAPAEVDISSLVDEYVLARRHSAFPLVDAGGRFAGLVTLDRLRDVPEGQRARVTARDVACPADEVPTANPRDAVVDVLPRLNACADGRVIVRDGGRIVGIVTPTDISRVIESQRRVPHAA